MCAVYVNVIFNGFRTKMTVIDSNNENGPCFNVLNTAHAIETQFKFFMQSNVNVGLV